MRILAITQAGNIVGLPKRRKGEALKSYMARLSDEQLSGFNHYSSTHGVEKETLFQALDEDCGCRGGR